jgi:GTP-binding protein Era
MSDLITNYCGFIAIIGRPNVGKSTLLNRLIGQKITITACKPQTTRHRILGIHTEGSYQAIYIDTPGIHTTETQVLNRWMNRTASRAMQGVDLIIMMVEGTRWTADDDRALAQCQQMTAPVILVINKIDLLPHKTLLLEFINRLSHQHAFLTVVPISAEQGEQVDTIARLVRSHLPAGTHQFPADHITDRSQRFLVAEIIREKLIRFLGEELPYAVTVEIEAFREQIGGGYHINGLIWVERTGQKKIVIGAQGQQLKAIGRAARQAIETLLGGKVYLELWVKVKSGWANDVRALTNLGYSEE